MLDVIAKIDELMASSSNVLVAIDGMAAAGKSTLAGKLAEHFNCAVVRMDDFFLPVPLKTPERLAEPGGNVDYERFAKEVLPYIVDSKPFSFAPFNCKIMDFDPPINYSPNKLTIVEGAYSLHPTLSHIYNLKIFIKIDDKTQMERILARNGEEMAQKFKNMWIPMEHKYFEAHNIKSTCDVVL